jgi:hypothetical protein
MANIALNGKTVFAGSVTSANAKVMERFGARNVIRMTGVTMAAGAVSADNAKSVDAQGFPTRDVARRTGVTVLGATYTVLVTSRQAALYDYAREGFLTGQIDWDTGVIEAALVRRYAFSVGHDFVSDVTGAGGTLVATVALTGKTSTNGVADANDATFVAVGAGAACGAVIVYQASAPGGGDDVAPSAQRLIAYYGSGAGLPVTPDGSDVVVTWNHTGTRMFKL